MALILWLFIQIITLLIQALYNVDSGKTLGCQEVNIHVADPEEFLANGDTSVGDLARMKSCREWWPLVHYGYWPPQHRKDLQKALHQKAIIIINKPHYQLAAAIGKMVLELENVTPWFKTSLFTSTIRLLNYPAKFSPQPHLSTKLLWILYY